MPDQEKMDIPMTIEEQIKAAMKDGKSKPAKKKKAKLAVVDPSAGQPVEPLLYRAVHVYCREGEEDSDVRKHGQQEARAAGPGTAVFTHYHQFGEECLSACRVREV